MITNRFTTLATLILCLVLAVLFSACAAPAESKIKMIGAPVGAVGHYGDMVGVSEYYANGRYIGSNNGWGESGKICCVALPRDPFKLTTPVMIDVKWITCDISHIKFFNGEAVDPSSRCKKTEHQATIPVNFAVETGDSSGIYIHFLPGNRVEAWVSSFGPASSKYPGPEYPRGPAPGYAPIMDRPALANPNQAVKID